MNGNVYFAIMFFKKEYSPLDFIPIHDFFPFDLVDRSIAYGLRDILEQMTLGTLDSLDPAEMANIAWALQQLQIRCDLAKKTGSSKGRISVNLEIKKLAMPITICVCSGWCIRYVFWQSLSWGLIELKFRPKEFHLYIPTRLCVDNIGIQLWVFYVFVAVISSIYT